MPLWRLILRISRHIRCPIRHCATLRVFLSTNSSLNRHYLGSSFPDNLQLWCIHGFCRLVLCRCNSPIDFLRAACGTSVPRHHGESNHGPPIPYVGNLLVEIPIRCIQRHPAISEAAQVLQRNCSNDRCKTCSFVCMQHYRRIS